MDFVEKFIQHLRGRAADPLFGGSAEAKVASRIADELEAERVAYLNAAPPMAEAVKESGYSEVQLRRLKKEGKWSGLRKDLPRRPQRPTLPGPQRVSDGRSLAERVVSRRRVVTR